MRTLQLMRDLPGISQRMLTQHLRELADDRLIERVDFGEKPLRVEYQLSEMGRQLLPVADSDSTVFCEPPRIAAFTASLFGSWEVLRSRTFRDAKNAFVLCAKVFDREQ